jgi:hypothetical protein
MDATNQQTKRPPRSHLIQTGHSCQHHWHLPPPCQYVLGINNDLLHSGMEDGSIPSTVADSACTSGVGTVDDICRCTCQVFNKQFFLPGIEIKPATEITEYPFKVREPAQELHIMPGITKNSLLCTGQFAAANYIIIFNKEEVNIYDANDTIIAVTRGAILQEWWDMATKLWRIPLMVVVRNNNIDTVIMIGHPPSSYPSAHLLRTQSTMSTSSKCSQN